MAEYDRIQKKQESRAIANSEAGSRRLKEYIDNRSVVTIQTKMLIQMKNHWKCSNCEAKGDGKPKAKCPECGVVGTCELVAEGRPKFGIWWESLGKERRTELLRAHGSHEDDGGVIRTHQGGGPGGKGDQHSHGVDRAQLQIKAKYERGDYD